jgi:hypothetical protein
MEKLFSAENKNVINKIAEYLANFHKYLPRLINFSLSNNPKIGDYFLK